jgi:hypothetical protein
VPLGECLQIARAPAAAEDPQHRDQQQEPLRVTHPAAIAAVGNRLEEADQIIRRTQIGCSGGGFGYRERRDPLTKTNGARPAKSYLDRLLGGPEVVDGLGTGSLSQEVPHSTAPPRPRVEKVLGIERRPLSWKSGHPDHNPSAPRPAEPPAVADRRRFVIAALAVWLSFWLRLAHTLHPSFQAVGQWLLPAVLLVGPPLVALTGQYKGPRATSVAALSIVLPAAMDCWCCF